MLARVLSVGPGVGLNKLWRSGDGERDVIYAIPYRKNTSQVQIAIYERVGPRGSLDGQIAGRM